MNNISEKIESHLYPFSSSLNNIDQNRATNYLFICKKYTLEAYYRAVFMKLVKMKVGDTGMVGSLGYVNHRISNKKCRISKEGTFSIKTSSVLYYSIFLVYPAKGYKLYSIFKKITLSNWVIYPIPERQKKGKGHLPLQSGKQYAAEAAFADF